MRKALWLLTMLGSVVGGGMATIGAVSAGSAPQEAAAASMGLAWAVIPYCLARAVTEFGRK